jgi:DNA adenine methylase
MKCSPVLHWAGGKTQLLSTINDRLPNDLHNIETYIEPFIGGGSVLFNTVPRLPNVKNIYINDLNYKLTNVYKVIKNNPNELISNLKSVHDGYNSSQDLETYYYDIRTIFNEYKYDKDSVDPLYASYFIFLNKTCFNGLYRENLNGYFNVPWGKRQRDIAIYDHDNIMNIHTLFNKHNVNILTGTFNEMFDNIGVNDYSKSFIYFDPPYRPLSGRGFVSYTKNSFNDDDQIDLANLFGNLSANHAYCMMSNSDPKNTDVNDNFFDDLYQNYTIERVLARRAINSDAKNRGFITELLIRNYN